MKPNVSIIILNWNGWEDTIECLESVYKIDYPNYNVIVIDNFSEDDSITKIKKYCEGEIEVKSDFLEFNKDNKPIKIIEITKEESEKLNFTHEYIENFNSDNKLILMKNDKNYGFAEGNNIGIRFALKNLNSEYILLLNNDTVVNKSFLKESIITAGKDLNLGIIGSTIYYYNNPQLIQSAGVIINWHFGEAKPIKNIVSKSRNLDAVSGCAILIKKELINKIGFLNSECFLYYEDMDFCLRVKIAGFKIINSNKSKVYHKTSVSSKKIVGIREYYSARNLFYLMKKYSKKKEYYCFLIYFFGFKLWFTLFIIIFYHKELGAVNPFLTGIFRGLK